MNHRPTIGRPPTSTMICVIPGVPRRTDDPSLERIYDEQAQYLDTIDHAPDRDELARTAVLHGFDPALPVAAVEWINHYSQRVVMVVATEAEPEFHCCDHGRSAVLARRPFRGPLRKPAIPAAHRHYTELRRCRTCTALQMVNVGPCGVREPSPWFAAPDDSPTWAGIYRAALTAADATAQAPDAAPDRLPS